VAAENGKKERISKLLRDQQYTNKEKTHCLETKPPGTSVPGGKKPKIN